MCGFCSAGGDLPCLKESIATPDGSLTGTIGADALPDPGEIDFTIPDNSSTTEVIAVGGTRTGRLDYAGDEDWYRLTLSAGDSVRIDLSGTGADAVEDTFLRLYDANSTLITFNDDGGPGLNSSLVFATAAGGTFYVEVDSYGGFYDGDYTLSVSAVAPPDITDSVRGQTSLNADDPILVYFATPGDTYTYNGTVYTADGVNAYEAAQLWSIFEGVEQIVNVDFEITTNRAAADLEWATDSMAGGLLGFFFFPNSAGQGGYGVLNNTFSGWSTAPGGGLDRGGFMYGVAIHELGHGLGLGHTHDSGNGTQVMQGVAGSSSLGSFALNQTVFTAMSYNDGWNGQGTTPGTYSYGYGSSFGAIDIAALQEMYGANTSHAGGDDVYSLATFNGSGTGYAAIWDTGGIDEIRYDGTLGTLIDLREATLNYEEGGGGFVSYTQGIHAGFTIANGVVIENATGGTGNDRLIGNASTNLLSGGGGDDTLVITGGDDTINGGSGQDVAEFAGLSSDYTFSDVTANSALLTDALASDGDDGVNLMIDVEIFRFADIDILFADLPGGAEGPQVDAQVLTVHETAWDGWSLGFVTATGTGGVLSYGLSGAGAENFTLDAVTGEVTVAAGAALDFETVASFALVLTVIEDGIGTDAALTIDLEDVLEGTSGADDTQSSPSLVWFEGTAGADTITGRSGVVDAVDYGASDAGVSVALGGAASGGFAAGDVLTSIENLLGSAFSDTLTGDGGANDLWGWLGADTLFGGAGDDRLVGDEGADRLEGGLGADTLDGGDGTDRATYTSAATGVTADLEDEGQNSGEAAGDVYLSIEQLDGSAHDDDLRGDAGSNFLWGGAGDDTLSGRDGNDFLLGGLGADILDGGAGQDRAQYSGANAGVTVDLANPGNNTGEAAGDTYASIEYVFGSLHADTITGDGQNNWLWGWIGDDAIAGGAGHDVLLGGEGADALDGGAGTDRAQYSDAAAGVTVDLANLSANTGEAAGDTYASIEQIFGSRHGDDLRGNGANDALFGWLGDDRLEGRDGNDILFGNEDDDTLFGGNGADRLFGGAGADALDGGAGTDRAEYSDAAAGVTANLGEPTAGTGDAAGDTFTGIENLYGSSHADTLTGDGGANWIWGASGDDALDGGAGDDILLGGLGADSIVGGAGVDRAQYSDAASAVTVDLDTPIGSAGEAAGDTFAGVENLYGSAHGDSLGGDAGNNWIWGWLGDDVIHGDDGHDVLLGGLGADTIDGGAGSDRAQYSDAASAVTVDLANQAANTGEAAGDVLISIEQLYGSRLADTLRGDAGNNVLFGWIGDDTLDGRDGADALFGNEGNDTLTGGAGADSFWFAPGGGDDTVTDFTLGEDQVRITGTGLAFAGLAITDETGGALVDFGGGTLLLLGIAADDLDAGDFLIS